MDLDTTIKGFTLTHEAILSIFKDVCAVQIDDDVQFEVMGVADIRETDDYPGIRVSLKANYPPISVPLTVDVTTGDMITPREIEYTFSMLFDDRTISVLAYNLETVLAELRRPFGRLEDAYRLMETPQIHGGRTRIQREHFRLEPAFPQLRVLQGHLKRGEGLPEMAVPEVEHAHKILRLPPGPGLSLIHI